MPPNSGALFRRKAVNRALQCATLRNDMESLFDRYLTAAHLGGFFLSHAPSHGGPRIPTTLEEV